MLSQTTDELVEAWEWLEARGEARLQMASRRRWRLRPGADEAQDSIEELAIARSLWCRMYQDRREKFVATSHPLTQQGRAAAGLAAPPRRDSAPLLMRLRYDLSPQRDPSPGGPGRPDQARRAGQCRSPADAPAATAAARPAMPWEETALSQPSVIPSAEARSQVAAALASIWRSTHKFNLHRLNLAGGTGWRDDDRPLRRTHITLFGDPRGGKVGRQLHP